MTAKTTNQDLAINGGTPFRTTPMPTRKLFGTAEKQAVVDLMDRAAREGSQVMGYSGAMEDRYCEQFCAMMGGGYADGVNSGSNAMYVALAALELEPLSEVIVPPISDPGGVMPVGMLGCVPVAADAQPGSFNVSAREIEAVLTERTSAIVVAHIGGIPVNMGEVIELARSRGVPIVEDVAQAHGAKHRGQLCGSFGDIAAFSTMFGKHHASGGQGAIVYTRNEALYWNARRYADRGKPFNLPDVTGNVACSLNCNMDEIHAAIGEANLAQLPEFVARRREVALALQERCRNLEAVSLWTEDAGDEGVYWFLTLRLDLAKLSVSRERFTEALVAEGIDAAMSGYPFFPVRMPWATERCPSCRRRTPCKLPDCAMERRQRTELANATAFEAESLRVIIHEGWTVDEADDLAKALAKLESAYLR